MSVKQTNRAFGLTFAAVFSMIGGALWWAKGVPSWWPFAVAAVFGVLALAAPGVLLPLNRLWMWFGGKFGDLNNRMILGIFYMLFMVPLGVAMRLFGRDPMHRRKQKASYWTEPQRQLTSETLSDMY